MPGSASRRDAVATALRTLIPRAPAYDLAEIADHAIASPGLRKAAPTTAAWLSLIAHLRHVYSDYDALLAEGYDLEAARHFCRDAINEMLSDWGCKKTVGGTEEELA